MELLLPLLAAVLVGTGVFLVLSRAMIRLILGLSMIAYGANISILLVTGMNLDAPPLLDAQAPYVDPLPSSAHLDGHCHRLRHHRLAARPLGAGVSGDADGPYSRVSRAT